MAIQRGQKVKLDSSDIATILAALRNFQEQYQDTDAMEIADDWPNHFETVTRSLKDGGDVTVVVPEPLGTDDIETLCEKINCAKVLLLD